MWGSTSQGIMTPEQSLQLYKYFEKNKYPSSQEMMTFAREFKVDYEEIAMLFRYGQGLHSDLLSEKEAEERFLKQEKMNRRLEEAESQVLLYESPVAKGTRDGVQRMIKEKDEEMVEMKMIGNIWRDKARNAEKRLVKEMKRTVKAEKKIGKLNISRKLQEDHMEKLDKDLQELQKSTGGQSSQQVMELLKQNEKLLAELEETKNEIVRMKNSNGKLNNIGDEFKQEHNRLRELVKKREKERDQLQALLQTSMQLSGLNGILAENKKLEEDLERLKAMNQCFSEILKEGKKEG